MTATYCFISLENTLLNAYREVEKSLQNLTGSKQPSKFMPESYIGSEYNYYKYLNVRVPHIRALQKKGFSFSNEPSSKQWKIWDYIWNKSDVFEVSLAAVHFVNQQSTEDLYKHRKLILKWVKRVDNWALSDEVSNFMARLLEYKPKEFMPYYLKWNKSKNPWERRLSMVGLHYYSRFRQRHIPFNTIIKLVDPHLEDPHYYVQKAVGWALRESWNVYPDKTYKYLEKKAHVIPPGGWTAATEKLTKADKARLTRLRKANK